MKKYLFLSILILLVTSLSAQKVFNTTITLFGDTHEIRFIKLDNEIFLNWNDLYSSLPGWFLVNSNGQIEVSPILQLSVLNMITESTNSGLTTSSSDVIESQIEGEFEGWDGETIFKLTNGQIWQQANYAYTYHYAYRPNVIIAKSGGRYIMQVEGVSETINVRRLK